MPLPPIRFHVMDRDFTFTLKITDGWAWAKFVSSSQGQVAGCFEDGNELLVCIPWGEEMLSSRGGLCSMDSVS